MYVTSPLHHSLHYLNPTDKHVLHSTVFLLMASPLVKQSSPERGQIQTTNASPLRIVSTRVIPGDILIYPVENTRSLLKESLMLTIREQRPS